MQPRNQRPLRRKSMETSSHFQPSTPLNIVRGPPPAGYGFAAANGPCARSLARLSGNRRAPVIAEVAAFRQPRQLDLVRHTAMGSPSLAHRARACGQRPQRWAEGSHEGVQLWIHQLRLNAGLPSLKAPTASFRRQPTTKLCIAATHGPRSIAAVRYAESPIRTVRLV